MLESTVKRAAKVFGLKIGRDWPSPPVSARAKKLIMDMWPVRTHIPLVRYGGAGDGAYLIPDDFDGVEALFSPGVDQVSTFESEMAERGMMCYLADASVDGPAVRHPAFRFERKFLGLRTEGDVMTFDDWVDRCEPGEHDLMLQMDIEGAEWTVLSNMSQRLLSRFRLMAIEFHSMSLLLDRYSEQIVIDVLQRLLATHYVVHNHPNNSMWVTERDGLEVPEVVEVTFLRKDRVEPHGYATTFPHPLDVTNWPAKPALVLPRSWHA